ncbi:hypothetical protein NS365_04150 [Aureimonas ureilytica]|uniref:Uncharacterized protein n=1 Tax=Aureimonas ureilytica TaxID=401562 RepID=A0A175RUM4_9HYPH|nr:hypothetical protein [Aureimonas ureilytica]KTR07485.1 hypothetical protein NS365_04150 [Aureimonas ureilytica]
MKTVLILEGFHAYPNGQRRDFAAGDTPDLANTFADLIIGKGLAEEAGKSAGGSKANPDPDPAA